MVVATLRRGLDKELAGRRSPQVEPFKQRHDSVVVEAELPFQTRQAALVGLALQELEPLLLLSVLLVKLDQTQDID